MIIPIVAAPRGGTLESAGLSADRAGRPPLAPPSAAVYTALVRLTSRSDPPAANEPRTRTTRVGGFRSVPALITMLGGDPLSALPRAGLAMDALDDPEARVPVPAIARLFADAAQTTRTPHFGLLAGRAWHLEDLGSLARSAQAAPTLGDALQRLVQHDFVHTEGAVAFLLRHGGVVDFGYAVHGARSPGLIQLFDALIAAAANVIRDLVEHWNPSAVTLAHRAPPETRHYVHAFRVKPRFDSEYCALRFADRWLDVPIDSSRATRLSAPARSEAEAGDIITQVQNAIRLQMLKGECSGDSAAVVLGMHRRTLNRRLAEHGTTYQACLDEVRYDLARQLLAESRISLDNIAAALAYLNISSFMRAFRRWSGTGPGAWRDAAV